MKKILFPTDFSDAAKNAFTYALALAKEIGAKVDVMHVYSLPFIDATNVPADYIEQMLQEKRQQVEEKLEKFCSHASKKIVGKRHALYGIFIPTEIKDQVRAGGYDLVVMGTRGEHHTTVEKLMGSITTHTMMQATCPVLAVPESASWQPIERIAFATDFEIKDNVAVRQLMDFSSLLDAEVHFVHVETKPGIGVMEDFITLANYPYKFTDFAVVNSPTVIEGVGKYIEEKNMNLLALFIPRRRLWERLFHSSFTKKMAFHSKTPLLVFHE